jgi:hypothetical protein
MKKIIIYFIGLMFVVTFFGANHSLSAAEETSTMMCDEGVVNIGDTDNDVREKCREPNTRGINEWVYEPGPSQSFTIIFKEGKVVRILESR